MTLHRPLILAFPLLFLLAGCPAPPLTPGTDLAVAAADLATTPPPDLAMTMPPADAAAMPMPDLSGRPASDLGNIDDPCVSACGCQQGMTCVANKCRPTPALIYCCDRPLCPKGAYCQLPNGGPSMCP